MSWWRPRQYRGISEIPAFFDGIFVVNLWCFDGGMWCLSGRFLSAENFPLFLVFFPILKVGAYADLPFETDRGNVRRQLRNTGVLRSAQDDN